MICPKCNNQIPDDSAFCPMCGNMNFTAHEAEQTSFEPGYTQPLVQPQDETGYTQPLVQPAPSQVYPTQAYQPQYAPVSPQPKKNISFIVIAALGGVAVIAIVLAILFGTGVLGGNDNGNNHGGAGKDTEDTIEKEKTTSQLDIIFNSDPTQAATQSVTEKETEAVTQPPIAEEQAVPVVSEKKIAVVFSKYMVDNNSDFVIEYVAADYTDEKNPSYYLDFAYKGSSQYKGMSGVYYFKPNSDGTYNGYMKIESAPDSFAPAEKEKLEGSVMKVDKEDIDGFFSTIIMVLDTKEALKEDVAVLESSYLQLDNFKETGDAKKYDIGNGEYIWIDADTGCLVQAEMEGLYIKVSKIMVGDEFRLPEVNINAAV